MDEAVRGVDHEGDRAVAVARLENAGGDSLVDDALEQRPDPRPVAPADGMALGVVEAVKAAGLQDKVVVFGTDGISDAYASIEAGELTGTVDSFPVLTGEVAMEVALRLIGKQELPRVVATPQALITKDNVETFAVKGDALREVLLKQAGK